MLEWRKVESKIQWENKKGNTELVDFAVWRAKVPGGWFVCVSGGDGYQPFFYPDPEHTWDGSALPG